MTRKRTAKIKLLKDKRKLEGCTGTELETQSQNGLADDPAASSRKRPRIKEVIDAGYLEQQPDLSRMLDMPLDVLYEIFGHLDPEDLLSLGRTSRNLKKTLLAPAAQGTWRKALDLDDGPPCPDDWTEPRWVALLYDKFCQRCSIVTPTSCTTTDWPIRRRLCDRCRTAVNKETIQFHRWSYPNPKLLMELTPFSTGYTTGYVPFRQLWHLADLAETARRLKDCVGNQTLFEAAVDEQKKLLSLTNELEEKHEMWQQTKNRRLYQAERACTERRFSDISERLKAMDFIQEEIDPLWDLSVVHEKKVLTDSDWLIMKEELVKSLFRARPETRRSTIGDRYKTYQSQFTLQERQKLPTALELCTLPELEQRIASGSDTSSPSDDFSDLQSRFPALIHAREETLKGQLLESLSEGCLTLGRDPLAVSDEVFKLAMCAVQCPRCDLLMFGWGEVQQHHCKTQDPSLYDILLEDIYTWQTYPLYSMGHLASNIEGILQLTDSSFDPLTTTIAQMDAEDPIVQCTLCEPLWGGSSNHYLTWRSYVNHCSEDEELEHKAERVPADVADRVRTCRATFVDEAHGWYCNVDGCTLDIDDEDYCPMALAYCEKHLLQDHGIQTPVENVHIFLQDPFKEHNTAVFVGYSTGMAADARDCRS